MDHSHPDHVARMRMLSENARRGEQTSSAAQGQPIDRIGAATANPPRERPSTQTSRNNKPR